MKNLLLFVLFTFCNVSSFSQPNFANYYTPTPGAGSYVYPVFDVAGDGNIFGISTAVSGGSSAFLFYKIDVNGNMVWQKDMIVGPVTNSVPNKICVLSDSTLAIVVDVISNANDFILIKCDLNGNVLWSKIYSSPSVFGGYLDIVPYGSGGVAVKGFTWIVFINTFGNIDNAYAINGPGIWDIAPKTAGSFTAWGTYGTGNFSLFDIDVNGAITNAFTYTIPGESTSIGGIWTPFNLISKSPAGGTFTTMGLQSASLTKFAVFYFDSANQPVWVKRVSLASGIESRFINAVNDNGCIITGPSLYFPKIIKLDSTGTSEWIKSPGDFSNSWNNFDIFTLKPDTGNGWYCSLTRPNIHLIHTDSVFNGFCHFENTQLPQISSVSVSINPSTIGVVPVTFSDSILVITSIQHNFYQYDACTDSLINSSTSLNDVYPSNNSISIFPNPAWDEITIDFPEEIQNGTIYIYNLVGKKIMQTNVIQKEQLFIDLSNLPSGMYIVQLNSDNLFYSEKLLLR